MRFNQPYYPQKPQKKSEKDLAETVAEEHPKHLVAVAEEQILAMHHHKDGSPVELHEVGSREFIAQSMASSSLEGKLGGSSGGSGSSSDDQFEKSFWQRESENSKNTLAAAKIEYERKSAQNSPVQSYGAQHSVTGASFHAGSKQEAVMMGCNCGAEWTVTGQNLKADPANPAASAAAVKVEQYGHGGVGQPGGYRASGPGGEKAEYRTSAGQQQDYKG